MISSVDLASVFSILFGTAFTISNGQASQNCSFSQLDPNYPLVTLTDKPLNAGTKVFQTIVGLTPQSTTTEFNWTVFHDTAVCYYGGSNYSRCKGCEINSYEPPPLMGFLEISLENVSSSIPGLLAITYNISYDVTELQRTPGIEGNLISETIGNSEVISKQIGQESCDLHQYYRFDQSFSLFKFSAFNVCTEVTCEGPYFYCHDNEFTACCKSMCKTAYCHNDGKCKHVHPDEEPQCYCSSNSNSFWYIGEKCQMLLAVWMIVISVVLSFVAIVLAALIAYCYYRRRKRKRQKELVTLESRIDLEAEATDNQAFNGNDEIDKTSITEDGFEERYVGGGGGQSSTISFDSSSTSSSDDKQVTSSSDSWSLEKQGYISSQDIHNLKTVSFEQDLPQKIHTYENIDHAGSNTSIGWSTNLGPQELASSQKPDTFRRPGWTPSLGPQILDSDPTFKFKFSPDTNI